MQSEPTVFIVDDDPAARDSVAALVSSKGMPVETFQSGEEFLKGFDSSRLGCVVADVHMGGMTGLDLQESLGKRGARLPVVLITGYGDIPTAVRAMAAGAFTFLEKPCRDHELWGTIRKALQWAAERQLEETRRADAQKRLAQLTPDEHRVMAAMVGGKSNKIIAQELDVGLRTIESRRASVLRKMQAESLADLVRIVLLAGDEAHVDPAS